MWNSSSRRPGRQSTGRGLSIRMITPMPRQQGLSNVCNSFLPAKIPASRDVFRCHTGLSSPCHPPRSDESCGPSPQAGSHAGGATVLDEWQHTANPDRPPRHRCCAPGGERSRIVPWAPRMPRPVGIDAAYAASDGTGGDAATNARYTEHDKRMESRLAKTAGSKEVTFTFVASLSLSIDDINRLAQHRWDTLFSESECSKRATQPCFGSSSPVPDDSRSRAFQFRGYLQA